MADHFKKILSMETCQERADERGERGDRAIDPQVIRNAGGRT